MDEYNEVADPLWTIEVNADFSQIDPADVPAKANKVAELVQAAFVESYVNWYREVENEEPNWIN